MSTIKITVLAENTALGLDLLGEHGLSFWIETPEARVLFDTGQGLALPHNVETLGVALDCADAVVLSHGHCDHTGGLSYALGRIPDARLFLHPAALASRFSRHEGVARAIGMPADVRKALDERRTSITWTTKPTKIAPGLFVTGPIPRLNGFEDTGGPFFLDPDGNVPDPIEDDQSLWIETTGGIVVLLGCAHSGVVNTLDYIREQTGQNPIRAIVGGMHMCAASDERMTRTIERLSQPGIGELRPCHCTGAAATARFAAAFGTRCRPCGAGTKLEL